MSVLDLLLLVLLLTVIGVALYYFNQKVQAISPGVKTVINVVVILACVLIAFNFFGGLAWLNRRLF